MYICDPYLCTGCGACKNICSLNAVSFDLDQNGRPIAVIKSDDCISCGLCTKICPVNSEPALNPSKACYAVSSTLEDDVIRASSGGVASGLYRKWIIDGGVVFGAKYLPNLELTIVPSDSLSDIPEFRGSKYVQASTGNSYMQAKQYLKEGRKVLYIAMPCQIAGLYAYLQNDHKNLYTVDIICHGVPPLEYLKKYCEDIAHNRNIDAVTFRGEHDFKIAMYSGKELIYLKDNYFDTYFWSFLQGGIFRENCYVCTYARKERAGNLTIGDFWGLDHKSLTLEHAGRISAVLVNHEKGEELLVYLQESFKCEERTVEEAQRGNHQLNIPSERTLLTDEFYENYKLYGVVKAMKIPFQKKERIDRIQSLRHPKAVFRKILKSIRSI